ncbi:MAG: tyrosine-type recombinase/integrase [bacterium]|nr:tyrosine-type recombinase/integrase [bacterium]
MELTPLATASKQSFSDDFFSGHGFGRVFASLLVSKGVLLYTVQHLLTHKDQRMTQRYAHLSDESLREGSEMIEQAISALGLDKSKDSFELF